MKNYIPVNYYDENKTTIYSSKRACEKAEGVRAVKFEQKVINLNHQTINNGSIELDTVKRDGFEQAKTDARNADELELTGLRSLKQKLRDNENLTQPETRRVLRYLMAKLSDS